MEKTIENSQQFLDEPELLTRSEVALLLHVSISYVDHLYDLPFYKIGSKKLYSKKEVLAYLSSNHLDIKPRKVSKTDSIYTREAAHE